MPKRAAEQVLTDDDHENGQLVLSLLNSVGEGAPSQRHIAAELGIALGLVNAYLKRCVKKGLVKVSEAPARRYAYYLTPQGFSEKSRLTLEYLTSSFSFFRRAKADCAAVFDEAKARGFTRIVLAGKSDLTEIAILSAVESGVEIVAVAASAGAGGVFAGKRVVASIAEVSDPYDAIVVTELTDAQRALHDALSALGNERVFVPKLLGLPARSLEAAQ